MIFIPVPRGSVPKRTLRLPRKSLEEKCRGFKMRVVDQDFRRQLDGYALATAEITYHMPDARSVLQTFVWQDYDLAPQFPELTRFLGFWERELEGPLHSVRVAHATLIKPAEVRFTDHELTLH